MGGRAAGRDPPARAVAARRPRRRRGRRTLRAQGPQRAAGPARGPAGGPELDAILVTRCLESSPSSRSLFSRPRVGQTTDRLLDALVELLVRLHLSGFFWGDCSLSNTPFRYDAGTLEAYLVDAENSERHPELSTGQRGYDLELAQERVFGELLDLEAGELLPSDVG